MKDSECVHFLQWALPHLGLRWPGFRKVRRQVGKRIQRRCKVLGLPDVQAYRALLEQDLEDPEWSRLDGLCRISISRFYRDRSVFDRLRQEVWPVLAQMTVTRGENRVRCWSAGCASGEEPYTLNLIWQLELQSGFPNLACTITATDTDPQLLRRCRAGRYPASCLRDLPQTWRQAAFSRKGDGYLLKSPFREAIDWVCQDIRQQQPDGPFQLILCRNLVFTYFEESLQRKLLERLIQRLCPGGTLIVGKTEKLPLEGINDLESWFPNDRVYRRPRV